MFVKSYLIIALIIRNEFGCTFVNHVKRNKIIFFNLFGSFAAKLSPGGILAGRSFAVMLTKYSHIHKCRLWNSRRK